MLTELQIETIIAETCGTYRTGDSYTFEDVWNCIEKALAAHSAGAQGEPVAWRVSGTYKSGLHFTYIYNNKATAEKRAAEAEMPVLTPLYAHPQPMPQTDAERDAKRYQAIRSLVLPFNAYASGNSNWRFAGYGPRGATFDEAIDAEIERLDRAKGGVMNLAELIRSRRNALGMTLEDLADAASSSKSYVHELESGKSYKMGLPLAARFALVLGINVNMMAVASLESERTAKDQ